MKNTVLPSLVLMLVAAGVAKSATTTVTYQVSASADDGYAWSATEQDTASGYLMIGDDRTYTVPYYMSAMRFTNVAIPRSAAIIDAHLKISSINEGYRGQIYGVIQAETADDAIDFSSRYIGAIGKTTAATDWDHKDAWAANTYYTSPDISSVIQEVVNRPGFGSGNSIAIYYSTRDLSGKARSFASYEYSPASAAGLEITYEYYTISGTVKTNRGVPLEGVQIDAGSDIESTVTDASGYYELYVPVGWSGQVKATNSTAWGFNIKTQLYTNVTTNQVNQNFTIFYPSISGTVMKEDGTPLAGATVTIDSVGSSYITDANGYYEIAVPYHWYGTVSANLVGYYFINKSYTHVTTDQTNQNFTAFQPKISGYVTDYNGIGVENVTVSADNGGGSDATDATGYYELRVPLGWSGTVTPSKTDWGFNPANQTYSNVSSDQVNQDYTAFQPKISGYVEDINGIGVEGVLVSADNGGGAVVTDANGHYSITVPYNWSGTVIPSKTGWNITPLSRSYSNVITNQTNEDYTAFQPKISGYVRDGSAAGVEGVSVSADNAGGSDTTDPNGYYEVTVPYDFSGTVTAYRLGWEITPLNRDYSNIVSDQAGQDYSAVYVGIIVKIDGTGDFNNIQAAIDAAVNGDVVVLQAGTYTGSGNRDIDFLGKAITVRGETGDANDCVIDCQGTEAEPHRGFKFVSGEDGNSVLEAITITNGYGPEEDIYGGGNLRSVGGAVYCRNSRYTINNCILRDNSADNGGGIYNIRSSPTISNCTINGNSAYWGGGISNGFISNPIINHCVIINNSAFYSGAGTPPSSGGGIFNKDRSSPIISNCTVSNNSARDRGGGIGNYYNSSPSISNCTLSNNSAIDYGGGIYNYSSSNPSINNCAINNNSANAGGGISNYDSDPSIERCTISNNSASYGGGIHNDRSGPRINWCIISGNSAEGEGGGVANLFYSRAFIKECTINGNSANSGGGVYNSLGFQQLEIRGSVIVDNSAVNNGGGIYSNDVEVLLTNCTIANNSAGWGGGLYNNGSVPVIFGSIVWWNQPSQIHGTVSATYSDIQGWGDLYFGNISVDPEFASDGYHLTILSPCIDAGYPDYIAEANETDIDGDPRVVGRLDMGADEFFVHDSGAFFITTKYYEFQALGIDSNTPPQSLSINNYGELELNWQIEIPNDCDWLSVSTLSGQTASLETSEVSISIDHNNIDYGTFSCQLIVSDPNAQYSPQEVEVNLDVLGPIISVAPNDLEFLVPKHGANPPSQTLSIQNTGYDTLRWQIDISPDCNWLSVEPVFGWSTGEVNEVMLSVDANGMDIGFYACELTISDHNAENSPLTVQVGLHVYIERQRHVPGEYATIQAAIDAAFHLEEVIIEPGIYTGPGNCNIYFRGKAITVRSIEPNNPAVVAATIIEPNTLFANGFNFRQGERADSVIDGLTIRRCISWAAIDCYYNSSPTIRNCIIEDNYSYDSGRFGGVGIACYESSPVISNCVIRNNDGSGLWSRRSEPTVRNCTFTGNRGSYHHDYYGETSLGGGILCEGGNISVINCTFSGNIADVGGGICSFGDYAFINNVTISNCIFWDNDANDGPQIALNLDYIDNPSTVSVSYSDVQGGEAAVYVDPCCTLDWDDDNNLDIDPCFAVPGYWHTNDTPEDVNDDFWVNGDYHLRSQSGRWDPNSESWYIDASTSPCIDAGVPNSDWSSELWPHGKRINMGAYGGTPEASMSLSDAGNIASLNGDDSVGYADIILFIEKWLYEEVLLPEDFDRNGIVNFTDFAIFADNWEGTPGQAGNPNPADGATSVDPNADLSWSAGYGASSHDVYFGTTDPPPFIRNQTATTFDPGTMDSSTVYYWRIDEVNSGGRTTGEVWTFGPPPPPPPPPPR